MACSSRGWRKGLSRLMIVSPNFWLNMKLKEKQHEKHFNKKGGDNVWKTQRKNYYNLPIAG